MEIPFWEDTYKDDTNFTFGNDPNQSVIKVENLIEKSSNIIDVGCGDGKNSLYLAEHGFKSIDAFDLSENAVNKLRRLSISRQLTINTWVGDLCNFKFTKKYGLIMAFGILHFISKSDWYNFIINAKCATAIGGINIIQLFTDKVPPSIDIAPYAIGLAADGEIRDLYGDWEIIEFKSYVFEEEHPNVPRHLHSSNKIIARRIK